MRSPPMFAGQNRYPCPTWPRPRWAPSKIAGLPRDSGRPLPPASCPLVIRNLRPQNPEQLCELESVFS